MTRAEALALLSSGSTHDRLAAARFLSRHAIPKDREKITLALRDEAVVWIRNALQQALALSSGGVPARPIEATAFDDADDDPEAYLRGVIDTTRRFLHELNPLLGLIGLYAAQEIPEYGRSQTKAHLDRLSRLASALDKLSKAAEPVPTEVFDLASCIRLSVEAGTLAPAHMVEVSGPGSVRVHGSWALVDLIISNALRNALEAEAATGNARPVVVTWGTTDAEAWVSVLDRGVGLPPSSDRAFDIGTSSKREHMGMGLAIAKQAARSLGGTIRLSPREGGGVAFEFRWPQPEGDE